MREVIAVDHGNRMVKTLSCAFPSGYMESDHLPHLGGDVLCYNGKEYTLSERRLTQRNDKTEDEGFFILTLFAIGKELLERPVSEKSESEGDESKQVVPPDSEDAQLQCEEPISVELLVGLPPLHYKALYKKFEQYFIKEQQRIEFELNKQPMTIEIVSAQAFPQAYAAALTAFDQINDSQIVSVVDIGGYTVDCLQLDKMRPNMDVCTSLYMGINVLFQRINEQIRATGAQNIQESVIESILLDDFSTLGDYSKIRIELVKNSARKFVFELLSEVAQTGLDLTEDKTVFVGGGSILLRQYLIEAKKAARAVFVDDIHANVKGYYKIYDTQTASGR